MVVLLLPMVELSKLVLLVVQLLIVAVEESVTEAVINGIEVVLPVVAAALTHA